jgi:hypothetical protein
MGKQELDTLVRINQLKAEPGTRAEFDGMVAAAQTRLNDARNNEDLSSDSKFDLVYGAAHRLALAPLRQKGYRSENRFTVFQALAHTVEGLDPPAIRIFGRAHNERNLAEYEGRTEVDERLLKELAHHTTALEKLVLALEPPAK